MANSIGSNRRQNAKRPYPLNVRLDHPDSAEILQVRWRDFETAQLQIIPNDVCANITVIFDNRPRARKQRPHSMTRYLLGILIRQVGKELLEHLSKLLESFRSG